MSEAVDASSSFHVLHAAIFPIESYIAIKEDDDKDKFKVPQRRTTRLSFLQAQQQSLEKDDEDEEDRIKGVASGTRGSDLTFFEASLLATTAEDTVTELRILVECNNELRIIKTMSDMYLLLADKYSIEQTVVEDELDKIDVKRLNCMEYKLNKLDSDRNIMVKLMTHNYVDLVLHRRFTTLSNIVMQMSQIEKYRIFLEEDEERNRVTYKELVKTLRQKRNHMKTVEYDANLVIDTLRTSVEDASLWTEIQSRYVDAYQAARAEQHVDTIRDKERGSVDSIDYFKTRSEYEQRVHTEIELLTNIVINETLQKIEDWMEKYDKDMEAIDLKIQIMRNDYEKMLEKRVSLENTIEKHDLHMKNWNHFKEERQKARDYHDKMTKSATTVQAWWRGLLVRRQIGPFRPKKKPKPGKKK